MQCLMCYMMPYAELKMIFVFFASCLHIVSSTLEFIIYLMCLESLAFYSSNFWTLGQINNAGTNKGFRPLLQFSHEDITQVIVKEWCFIQALTLSLNQMRIKVCACDCSMIRFVYLTAFRNCFS